MKHLSPGLSDSIASVIAHPTPCPHCESSSHISGGLCVGCLLQTGLEPEDECAGETLGSVLSEISIPDKNWRLGNYEVLEEIGRGGMGVIYRARQRHSRRIVAVKRVLSYHADSQETLARFRREAQAAASLDHPNILPIYEVSESEDGLPFFSMKFAPGGSLQEVGPALKNEPRQCVALVAKIARAVQYAHGKGILHRDLKPGNIVLDGRGEPLVSDFGLAKWLDTTSDLTRTLTIFGTPGYIAPEQASGSPEQLKPAADVYSLGAILFDLLAGRPPFLGSHALSVIRQAAENPAPKLRSLSKVADRDLETICARCLEREPSARYHSAHDLAEDLERWLEGRPIVARPVSPTTQLWRWSRRNPLLAGAIGLALLLGGVALLENARSLHLTTTIREEEVLRHSIAVLPFLDLDTEAVDHGLADTFSAALQSNMSRLGPSRVVAIANVPDNFAGGGSVPDVRETGKRAGSRAVLSGTRRVVHGKLRTAIRLMNAATGESLFSRTFDLDESPLSWVNSLSNASSTIRSILDAPDLSKLAVAARDPGMRNEDARDLILAGRELYFRYTLPDFDRAIGCFEKAIIIEPDSSLAHAYLAAAIGGRSHYFSSPQSMERAEYEARESLRLDPDSPDAYRTLAGVMFRKGQTDEAIQMYLRAIELGGPEERVAKVIARAYAAVGRPDRSVMWIELARHWETRPGESDLDLGDYLALLGLDKEAEATYRRAADLHPELPSSWLGLCRLRLLQSDAKAARELFTQHCREFSEVTEAKQMLAQIEFFDRNFREAEVLYEELTRRDPEGGGGFYGNMSHVSALGWLRMAKANDTESRSLLRACLEKEKKLASILPNNADALYRMAALESSLGETDTALLHLRDAVKQGYLDYRSTAVDPRFDRMRSDLQFHEILEVTKNRVTELSKLIRNQKESRYATERLEHE
jgi:serine/threonine protein kinase/tetratricopeptide (TPR) repeat protein